MTVYIEYVLIDNFIIDYLLLKTTFLLTKTEYKTYRLLLTSVLGSVIALLYPLVNISAIFIVILKLAVGIFLLFISNRFYSVKSVYVNFLVFLSLTFLMGGAIIGVYSIAGLSYDSEISVALIVIPFYVIYRGLLCVIKYLYVKKERIKVTFPCKMFFGEKCLDVLGFLDTGNGLTYNGDGVILCDKKTFGKILDMFLPKIFKIPCNTVGGKTSLLAFKISKFVIYRKEKENIFYNVTVAVGHFKVGDGYDLILHPYFLGEDYVETDKGKIKKVS